MKKVNIVLLLLVFFSLSAKSQVKDISFTLSPTGEYTWWDDKSGFHDGALVGGKLGFGFGEYIELRAIYQQSLDLKTSFESFGLNTYDSGLFTEQDVTLTRWGGEFKANIGTKKLSPYFTVGTGIQSIELENADKLEQIYASLGLGIKFNLAKRIVFTLEGKNTTYKFDAGKNLLADGDKTAFGVTDADFSNTRLSNWSVMGSLQFYLGGRTPGTLSSLDQAYLKQFKGGFKGLQFVLEPSANHLAFDNNSLFRDTWMLGGYAGLDFNEYVGIRAFYLKATENDELSTSFDKLSMYGLEFRANLNDGNGVIPYLILGGGYLNPASNYMGVDSLSVDGTEFASAGLGLTVPLGKNVAITGGARAMVTSGSDITDINGPKDLQTHLMYNVGLKFNLGKKSKSPNAIYEDNLNKELDEQQTANNQKIQNLKAEYQDKINNLELDLKSAYQAKDVDKVVALLEEKKEVAKFLKQVEEVEVVQAEKEKNNVTDTKVLIDSTQEKLIQMTPQEFESLIDRILNNLNETPKLKNEDNTLLRSDDPVEQIKFLNIRIDALEKLLLGVNVRKDSIGNIQNNEILENDISLKILNKLEELNNKIDGKTEKVQEKNTIIKDTKEVPNLEKADKNDTKKIILDEKGNLSDDKVEESTIIKDTIIVAPILDKTNKTDVENNESKKGSNVAQGENTNARDSIRPTLEKADKNDIKNNILDEKENVRDDNVKVEESVIIKDTIIIAPILDKANKTDFENKESKKEGNVAEGENTNTKDSIKPTLSKVGIIDTENKKLDEGSNVVENESKGASFLNYNSSSVSVGANVGEATTANFGLRMYYDIKESNFQLMPEVYVGVGDKTSYGLSGNVIYQFSKISEKVNPYVGAGIGFGRINDKSKGNYNLIVGAELPFLLKNLYVDFITRNLFDYNQVAIGYKLNF